MTRMSERWWKIEKKLNQNFVSIHFAAVIIKIKLVQYVILDVMIGMILFFSFLIGSLVDISTFTAFSNKNKASNISWLIESDPSAASVIISYFKSPCKAYSLF